MVSRNGRRKEKRGACEEREWIARLGVEDEDQEDRMIIIRCRAASSVRSNAVEVESLDLRDRGCTLHPIANGIILRAPPVSAIKFAFRLSYHLTK